MARTLQTCRRWIAFYRELQTINWLYTNNRISSTTHRHRTVYGFAIYTVSGCCFRDLLFFCRLCIPPKFGFRSKCLSVAVCICLFALLYNLKSILDWFIRIPDTTFWATTMDGVGKIFPSLSETLTHSLIGREWIMVLECECVCGGNHLFGFVS